jgi:hypothetical protein
MFAQFIPGFEPHSLRIWPPVPGVAKPANTPEEVHSIVGQVVGRAVPVVRLWFDDEPDGSDGRLTVKDRPCDAVHSIHHPSVGPKNDRVLEINLLDESDMVNDAAHRRGRTEFEPVVRVNIRDGVECHLGDGQISAGPDEVVNVPGVETPFAGSEVVLLSHSTSLSQTSAASPRVRQVGIRRGSVSPPEVVAGF